MTGGASFTSPRTSYTVVKLNTNGNQLWVQHYGDPLNGNPISGNHIANAVAVDHHGSIFVTGASPIPSSTETTNDIATIKYDTDGNQLWVQRYDGPGNGNDEGKAIAVDGQGSVYVAGYQTVPGGGTELIVIKYATLQNIALQPNGQVALQFFGLPGQTNRIQASTTLTNWIDLGTALAGPNNISSFIDTNAPAFPYRFYRSVSP